MNDMSAVIVPKSDQINADTLLAGPMTVTVKEVRIQGGQEQPVTILLEETNLVYRPCKSMSRVLVQGWGPDAKQYAGRGMTLYRDPSVKWAGMEVGGIRISHMSHIDGPQLMMLTATKGNRKPHKVMPLIAEVRSIAPQTDRATAWANSYMTEVGNAADIATLDAFVESKAEKLAELRTKRPTLADECDAAVTTRRNWLAGDEDTFGGDE